MPLRLDLSPEHLTDFEAVQELGRKALEIILKRLDSSSNFPLTQSGLRRVLADGLTSSKGKAASEKKRGLDALLRVLLGLGFLQTRSGDKLDNVLGAVELDLKEAWSSQPDKLADLNTLRTYLSAFLKHSYVRAVVKAMDVSQEYANLLLSTRIMTDVRPIFNDEGDQIEGAVVSFTLRLNFLNAGRQRSMTLAVDATDIETLAEQCARAMRKANTAQQWFSSPQDVDIPITIAGKEEAS
jgi:hypothetical protein